VGPQLQWESPFLLGALKGWITRCILVEIAIPPEGDSPLGLSLSLTTIQEPILYPEWKKGVDLPRVEIILGRR
jgi:hypothetical protein